MPVNNIISRGKDGRFRYFARDKTGTRYSLTSRKGESRKDFSKRCDELDEKLAQYSDEDSFDALFRRWIEDYAMLNNTPTDVNNCIGVYRNHIEPVIGRMDAREIKRRDAYRVLSRAQRKGLSAGSIARIRGCISRPYNWAIDALGYDLQAPTTGLIFRMKEEDPVPMQDRVIKNDDMERFFEAAQSSKYYAYFQTLKCTGMRPSEALGLKISDIKDDVISVRRSITLDGVGKLKTKNAYRDIPLTNKLREILQNHIDTQGISFKGWLFPAESGEPSKTAVNNAFQRIRRRTGSKSGTVPYRPPVQFSMYDFRHTFATRMAMLGMSEKSLQMIMGHSSITITYQYYVGYEEEQKERARGLMEAA